MDSRKHLTKKQRRRLSQRSLPVEQVRLAAESLLAEDIQVATEQPVGGQAVAEQSVAEPIVGGILTPDVLIENVCESLKRMSQNKEIAKIAFGEKIVDNINIARKNLTSLYEKCHKDKEEAKQMPGIPFLGFDVSFQVDENTSMEIYREHLPSHVHFAGKVFDYLLKCYGLRVPSNQESDEYYENFMGEAILSFCILYRDKWREKFKTRHKTLVKLDYFVVYCCAIPVERDSHYFYNYLLRVAIIFEMAVYCFDYDYDYFEIAQNCASQFVDVIFFRDEGSWTCLKSAASAIAIITRPLRFVVNCPKRDAGCFADVIESLEGYTSRSVINMTNAECALLKEVNEKLLRFQSSSNASIGDISYEILRQNHEDLIKPLMSYFAGCLPENFPISLKILTPKENDNLIDFNAWLHNSDSYDAIFKEYRSFKQGETDESSFKLSVHLLDCHIERCNRDFAYKRLQGGEARGTSTTSAQASSRLAQTGAVPKKRNVRRQVPIRESGNYIQFDKLHVEEFVKLYIPALSSFLNSYADEYLAPNYALTASCRNENFLIDGVYYEERKTVAGLPEMHKRMSGSILPDKAPVVVPIEVQRLLDSYIADEPNSRARMFKGHDPIFAVPKIPETVKDGEPVWVIKGTLDKHGTSIGKAVETMPKFTEMLMTRHFRTSKAEADEETIHMFRLKTTSETHIRVLGNAVPKTTLQDPKSQRHPGKKKKHKKKSKK